MYHVQTEYRDGLAKYLKDNGIYTTFRYYPLHLVRHYNKNQQLENSGKSSAPNKELSIVSFISRTISIPLPSPRTSINGLVTLGRKPFLNAQANIVLEGGTINTNGILIDADSNEIVLEDETYVLVREMDIAMVSRKK